MPKFATQTMRPAISTPIGTTTAQYTHEGGVGFGRDAKSELFVLAISNLVGEDTFYESAQVRDGRYSALVAQVTAEDPEWVAGLVPWLRDTMNLRSVAVVTAAEYVKAGGQNGRGVISAALKRADEPAEMLAYWLARYGRKIPMAVKRGVADSAVRLYSEYSLLRYDGHGKAFRFADVIDLVHPKPKDPRQGELFKHALDRRHGHADSIPEDLAMLRADRALQIMPEGSRRVMLEDQGALAEAGWSWERLAGWLPGGMDAAAWEAIIPTMGYMALLRNLRNFDQAKVSDPVAQTVIAKLSDPAEVAKSRQLPIRFYSAWREVQSLRWAYALEQAVDLSLANVPSLPGRTLILVDVSGSMMDRLSQRGDRQRWEVASIFGVALAKRAANADLMLFRDQVYAVDYSAPLLRLMDGIRQYVGGGTYLHQSIQAAYAGHDRVIVLTDEQAADAGRVPLEQVPLIYTFNLAGYQTAHIQAGPGRYTFGGGLSDACFGLLTNLEATRDGAWPHLNSR